MQSTRPTTSLTADLERADRARETADWNEDHARQAAQQEGVTLTPQHLEVLHFLRDYYVNHGWPDNAHDMSQILDERFAAQGGKRYLHQLFNKGPLAQGSRLAGLPTPAYAVDKSFGTAH